MLKVELMMEKIAIIRIRGETKIRKDIKDTLAMLRLYKKNTCVIIDIRKDLIGMLKKVKDYVTWGELDKETLKLLLEKRGLLPGKVKLDEKYLKKHVKVGFDDFVSEVFSGKKKLKDVPGLKSFFRLNPPVGGFERKGIKEVYVAGGVLGYRKDGINKLIKKMI